MGRRAVVADWDGAKEQYPSTGSGAADWQRLMSAQPDVLHSIVADIVKVVKATDGPKKTGRRPSVAGMSFDELWEVLYPKRYTLEPFQQALAELMGGRTQKQIALKVPCNQSTIARLLSGEMEPDVAMMRRIAAAVGVPATYFVEYRALRLGEVVTAWFLAQPNLSIPPVKLVGGKL